MEVVDGEKWKCQKLTREFSRRHNRESYDAEIMSIEDNDNHNDNVHRGCTAVVIMSQSQSKRKKLLMVKNENVRILTHRTIKKATVRR